MQSSNQEVISSQLQAAFKKDLDERFFEAIIKSNFNINHKIGIYDSKGHYVKDTTALHLAFDKKKIKIFKLFLRYGADILHTDDSSTVLHKAIQGGYDEKQNSLKDAILPFVQSVLAVHVDSNINANPFNNHGISHFHAACIVNHVKVVEFFLTVGLMCNRAIYSESPVLPGYTCLHLAVRYYALETLELLLKNNPNMNVREKTGLTPIQLLVKQKIELHELISNGKVVVNEAITKELEVSDKILCLLLENLSQQDDAYEFYPYAVCTLSNSVLVQKLLTSVINLKCSIDASSRWWPGYTMFHFAAHCNVNTLLLLMNRGGSIEVKDAKGQTPFDLCLKRYGVECIHSLITNQPTWKDITLSDRRTKLRDVIFAMRDPDEFKNLLQNIRTNINKLHVPEFSSLWPGSTLLHLAVYFSKHQHLALILECLSRGADVTLKDSRGWTPVQLAFRQYKIRSTNLLLQHQNSLDNPRDEDNLSHLHIACAMRNLELAEKLASSSADLELAYKGKRFSAMVKEGATPIHVAVASESCEIAELLLRHGANLEVIDNTGLTPVHRALAAKNAKGLGTVLLSQPNLRNRSLEAIGLNCLHVASYVGHAEAVARLLELGVNIDASVHCWVARQSHFSKFSGFSPLHFAIEGGCKDVARLLVEFGADILAKRNCESTLLYDILISLNVNFYELFVSTLRKNYAFQARMAKDSGTTMLHVACHALDLDFAKHLLNVGLNVNAQTKRDSAIWPECTPLHVLAKRVEINYDRGGDTPDIAHRIDQVLQLLLDNGADVTVIDADRKTPVHLFFEYFEQDDPRIEDYARLGMLLKAQKDFKVNPVTAIGVSHFHVACLVNEAAVVEQFLKNGVSVHDAIDTFASHVFAGRTALHLSAGSYLTVLPTFEAQLETTDLLLQYGADVTAKDSCENTPAHCAAECTFYDLQLFEKLVSAGADITAKNIRKETPFECLLRADDVGPHVIDFFIKNGYRLNTFKPITEEGTLGQMFGCLGSDSVLEVLSKAPEFVEIDNMSRTLIHNVSSLVIDQYMVITSYSTVIEKLIELGCDIDAIDHFGRTALHMAVKFHNVGAVNALLDNGADINVADSDGISAFAYSLQSCDMCNESEFLRRERRKIIEIFATHVSKLQQCEIFVSYFNKCIQVEAFKTVDYPMEVLQNFGDELNKMKSVKIGSSSFVLYDFLSETGAVAVYPSTQLVERIEINKFFNCLRDFSFDNSVCLLKLQFRKALNRWQLNEDATIAIQILLKFSLPEVCCRTIFRFLSNSDLMTLIESADQYESEDMELCED